MEGVQVRRDDSGRGGMKWYKVVFRGAVREVYEVLARDAEQARETGSDGRLVLYESDGVEVVSIELDDDDEGIPW